MPNLTETVIVPKSKTGIYEHSEACSAVLREIVTPQYQATSITYCADRRAFHVPHNKTAVCRYACLVPTFERKSQGSS